ncbi:MAG: arginase family protein [archaeon]
MDLYLNKENLVLTNSKKPLIGLIGIPWDSCTVDFPGQRFAPNALRDELRKTNFFHFKTKTKVDELFTDFGNLEVVHGNQEETIERLEKTIKNLLEQKPEIKPFFAGGNHSITYMTCSSLKKARKKSFSLIVFDTHTDIWKDYSNKLFQGNFNYLLLEQGIVDKIIVVGVKEFTEKDYREELKKFKGKLEFVFLDEIEKQGLKKTTKKIKEFIGKNDFYLSIDIDVLNAWLTTGTGCNESIYGLQVKDLIEIISGLNNKNLVALDLVEVNPLIDKTRITIITASYIFRKLLVVLSRGLK